MEPVLGKIIKFIEKEPKIWKMKLVDPWNNGSYENKIEKYIIADSKKEAFLKIIDHYCTENEVGIVIKLLIKAMRDMRDMCQDGDVIKDYLDTLSSGEDGISLTEELRNKIKSDREHIAELLGNHNYNLSQIYKQMMIN